MDDKAEIVADGRERAMDGSVDRIRAEVEAKYAEELRTAGFWKRRRIRQKIEREIEKRLERIAPKTGLY